MVRKATLEQRVQSWENARNAASTHIDWQFTTDDARIKLRSLYPSVQS